jgi:hypothetical protein
MGTERMRPVFDLKRLYNLIPLVLILALTMPLVGEITFGRLVVNEAGNPISGQASLTLCLEDTNMHRYEAISDIFGESWYHNVYTNIDGTDDNEYPVYNPNKIVDFTLYTITGQKIFETGELKLGKLVTQQNLQQLLKEQARHTATGTYIGVINGETAFKIEGGHGKFLIDNNTYQKALKNFTITRTQPNLTMHKTGMDDDDGRLYITRYEATDSTAFFETEPYLITTNQDGQVVGTDTLRSTGETAIYHEIGKIKRNNAILSNYLVTLTLASDPTQEWSTNMDGSSSFHRLNMEISADTTLPDTLAFLANYTPKETEENQQFIPLEKLIKVAKGTNPIRTTLVDPVPNERKTIINVRDLKDLSNYTGASVEIREQEGNQIAQATTDENGQAHLGYIPAGNHTLNVSANNNEYFSRTGANINIEERILWSDSLHTGEQNITLFEKEMTIPGTEGQTLTGDAAELREVIPTTYHYKESIGMKDIMYLHNFSAIDSSAFMRFTQEIADLFYDGEIPFEFGRTTPFDHDSAGVYVDRGELDKIGWNVYKGGATTDPARYNINGKLAIVGGEIEINFLSIDTKKELQFRRKDNDDVTTRVSYGNPGSTVEPTDKDRAYSNFRTQWETTYSSGHDDFLDLNQTITE